MDRGVYNSVGGMLRAFRNVDVISHNISNVSSTGYKSDDLLEGEFENMVMLHRGRRLGEVNTLTGVRAVVTDFQQGGLVMTERKLDVALIGEGFLVAGDEAGDIGYLRDGNMQIVDGYLTDNRGNFILGEEGPINVGAGQELIRITSSGEVYRGDEFIDALRVVGLESPFKQKNGYYSGVEIENDAEIKQGYLEGSNVDLADEMTELIKAQRSMQLNQKMFKVSDDISSGLINKVNK